MKKSKLIALLNEIDGNPDILLWNGFVGDWMDIENVFVECSLYKQKLDSYIQGCVVEWKEENTTTSEPPEEFITELKRVYNKVNQYEHNNFITERHKPHYREKKVFLLNAKPRKKSTFSRGGSAHY
jgi:hypothetical protein